MCYHVKYGPPASKGVCINRREPTKLGSAGGKLCPLRWWHSLPLEIHPSPHYPAEFGHSRSNSVSVMEEVPLKNLTLTSHLSKSFKVIRTDTDQLATHDFLLSSIVTMGLPLPRYMEISVENRKFLQPYVFNAPAKGVPLNWVTMLRLKIFRIMGLSGRERSLMISLSI